MIRAIARAGFSFVRQKGSHETHVKAIAHNKAERHHTNS